MDTSSKKIPLAVNIICKDEIATIEALVGLCADNFQHVVINDTGSTDGTFEVLYALSSIRDNITLIQNTWEKDFARARNQCKAATSLNFSHILVLDCDETLEPDSLAQMHSQEFLDCLKPNCLIQFRLMNTELDGTIIDEFHHTRIFPNTKSFTWEGVIHEHIHPDTVETHYFREIKLMHIGYRSNDPVFTANKRARNIELLLTQPDTDYKHLTLGNEYFTDRTPEAMMEYTKAMTLTEDPVLLDHLRYMIAMCFEKMDKHEIASGWYLSSGKRDALARLANYYLYKHPVVNFPAHLPNHSVKLDTLTQELGIEYCKCFLTALKLELPDPYGSHTTMLEKFCRDELTKRVIHEN